MGRPVFMSLFSTRADRSKPSVNKFEAEINEYVNCYVLAGMSKLNTPVGFNDFGKVPE
jgi:hypothetical protein